MRLHVPAVIGAVQLSSWRSREALNNEAEILLQRDLRLRVISDQIEAIPGGRAGSQVAFTPPNPPRLHHSN
jgi:hypothetical protein